MFSTQLIKTWDETFHWKHVTCYLFQEIGEMTNDIQLTFVYSMFLGPTSTEKSTKQGKLKHLMQKTFRD